MSWRKRAGREIEPSALRRAVAGPIVALTLLLFIGVVGYTRIEGWTPLEALWMISITITTIGYGEVHPLSDAGRVFTIGLMAASLFVGGQAITALNNVGGVGLAAILRQRRIERELAAMHQHSIVIGYGRLGREIAAGLLHQDQTVVAIDPNPGETPTPPGLHLLIGDATQDAVLEEAGILRAASVAISTPSDPVNIYLTLTIRQLHPTVTIVTRIEEDGAVEKARRAGATRVFQPYHVSGARMVQALLRPAAATFLDHAESRHRHGLHMEDVTLPAGSPARGRLASLQTRRTHGVSVVAVLRVGDAELQMPDEDTRVDTGDTLVIVGRTAEVRAFAAWAQRRPA